MQLGVSKMTALSVHADGFVRPPQLIARLLSKSEPTKP